VLSSAFTGVRLSRNPRLGVVSARFVRTGTSVSLKPIDFNPEGTPISVSHLKDENKKTDQLWVVDTNREQSRFV
jgi:hypothetical protein